MVLLSLFYRYGNWLREVKLTSQDHMSKSRTWAWIQMLILLLTVQSWTSYFISSSKSWLPPQ